jgi:hypothetical protein
LRESVVPETFEPTSLNVVCVGVAGFARGIREGEDVPGSGPAGPPGLRPGVRNVAAIDGIEGKNGLSIWQTMELRRDRSSNSTVVSGGKGSSLLSWVDSVSNAARQHPNRFLG